VVFVVDIVALGQAFLRVFNVSPVSIIPPRLSILIIFWGMNKRLVVARPQFRNIVSPPST
jgi:hypothetical protein